MNPHPPVTKIFIFCFRSNYCSFYSGSKALAEEVMGFGIAVDDNGEPEWRTDRDLGYIWRLRIPFNNLHSSRNYISKIITYPRLLEVENSISHLEEFVNACGPLADCC